jgi:hypothetical protein
MLAIGLDPIQIDPSRTSTRQQAFLALSAAASHYLQEFDHLAGTGVVPPGTAAITRVRGTGPGVSFGAILSALFDGSARMGVPVRGQRECLRDARSSAPHPPGVRPVHLRHRGTRVLPRFRRLLGRRPRSSHQACSRPRSRRADVPPRRRPHVQHRRACADPALVPPALHRAGRPRAVRSDPATAIAGGLLVGRAIAGLVRRVDVLAVALLAIARTRCHADADVVPWRHGLAFPTYREAPEVVAPQAPPTRLQWDGARWAIGRSRKRDRGPEIGAHRAHPTPEMASVCLPVQVRRGVGSKSDDQPPSALVRPTPRRRDDDRPPVCGRQELWQPLLDSSQSHRVV